MVISLRQDRDAGILLLSTPALTAFAKSKIPSVLDSLPRTVLADLQANPTARGFCFMAERVNTEQAGQLKHVLAKHVIEDLFRVDLDNGRLFWRKPSKYHSEKTGSEARGAKTGRGGKAYWVIKIGGLPYNRAHLIFCLIHGRFPYPQLDHINGNSLDDRPSNIREATATQNAWNHKGRRRQSPLPMGVRLNRCGSFEARISFNKTPIQIGSYKTLEAAHDAYLTMRKELYGEFA